MDSSDVVTVLGNLDRRMARIEQHLPSLPTREEMHAAIREAVVPLATKAELREEGERTRRHFDVVAESVRDDIQLIAEGHIDLGRRMDARHHELAQADARLDARVSRLESIPRKRR